MNSPTLIPASDFGDLLAKVFALIAAFIGITALAGWLLKVPVLASFGEGWIPMSPGAAILFVALLAAIWLGARQRGSPATVRTAMAIAATVALAALALLFVSLVAQPVEPVLFAAAVSGSREDIPLWYISPLSAASFALAGLSFLASIASSQTRRFAVAGFWLAAVVSLLGVVFLLPYLYGSPLLYGGAVKPPAIPTTVAIAFVGASLLAFSAPRAWAQGEAIGAATRRTSVRILMAFAAGVIGIAILGAYIGERFERQQRAEVEGRLEAVSALKAHRLVSWYAERLADADFYQRNAAFASQVKFYLDSPSDVGHRKGLVEWLEQTQKNHHYDAFLLDVNGNIQLSMTGSGSLLSRSVREKAITAIRSRKPELVDFYASEDKSRVYLALLVPLSDPHEPGRVLGALAWRFDPRETVYPEIEGWPVPSPSAETVLVRRNGDHVQFLNEVRFLGGPALSLQFPLDRTDIPAVRAVLGFEGIVEGVDYRGVPTIASVRAVPGTPWFVIARMDVTEAFASLRQLLWMTLGLAGTLLASGGTTAGVLWRGRGLRHADERAREAEKLARLTRLYDMLSQTNQAIVRLTTREELFSAVCRIAVTFGQFHIASIVMTDPRDGRAKSVARYSDDADYVNEIRATTDDSDSLGHSLTARAMSEGEPMISNDFIGDAATVSWHESARRAGLQSIAVFPLRLKGKVVGAMKLFSRLPGFFSEDVLPTLTEMAVDVSFALDNFAREEERANAVVAARESERRCAEMFSASPHPMWAFERETQRLLKANDAAVMQYGWSEDEYSAMTVSDLYPSEDRLHARDLANRLGISGRIEGEIARHRRKDGSQLDVEIGARAVVIDGQPSAVMLALDVSSRLLGERQLRESEEKFRRIFDSLQDVYVEAAINGMILEVSPQVEKLSRGQYKRKDLLGSSAGTFYAERHQRETFVSELQKKGHVDDFESTFRNRDGSLVPLSLSAKLNFDESGRARSISSMVRDISERKRAEQALRDTEEQYRGMVEQSIAGSYLIQDRVLVFVNHRLAEIFGYASPDELVGRDAFVLVVDEEREHMTEALRGASRRGEKYVNYNFTGVRKDGSRTEIGLHSTRAIHRGRPAIMGLVQDISEKKRAEERIVRYVKELQHAFMSTVEVAMALGEMRDPYTAGHERRVAEIATAIGAQMGFDAHRQEGLRVAGYLHDVGKITVPSEILSKPGRLSNAEYMIIKGHPQAGYDVLKSVEFPWPVAQVALQHHERLDGSGYPQGLKGEAILLEARIMSVADVVEAMSSHRPYRAGLGIDKALSEIERGRGTAYDPVVVDACLELFREKGYVVPE